MRNIDPQSGESVRASHENARAVFTAKMQAAQDAETVRAERRTKRHRIVRWRTSRLRRIDYEIERGRATPRQALRAEQLRKALCHSV